MNDCTAIFLRRRQADAAQDEALAELQSLSARQTEVLLHYAKGCTVFQSARLLGIKVGDVHNERGRIMALTGGRMIEAAMTAARAGLV